MAKPPVLKPREVAAILQQLGFVEIRQRAAHTSNTVTQDGRCTTLPFHPGRDLSPILLKQIAKDIGLTIDEFLRER